MSALTDALRIVLEPFKFLLDRAEKKADEVNKKIDDMPPPPVQSDMAQSDPEAPDYIKNRIAYDDRKRTAIIFDGDIDMNWYWDGTDWIENKSDYEALNPDKLYAIDVLCNGVMYSMVGKLADDPDEDSKNNYKKIYVGFSYDDSNWLHYIKGRLYNNECGFAFYGMGNMHVTISEIEESGEFKAIPTHLLSGIPRASENVLGGVRVWNKIAEKDTNNYESVCVTDSGYLYTRRYNLPDTVVKLDTTPTTSDSGKIPVVQEDGTWGLGEVASGGSTGEVLWEQTDPHGHTSIGDTFEVGDLTRFSRIEAVFRIPGMIGDKYVTAEALPDPEEGYSIISACDIAYVGDVFADGSLCIIHTGPCIEYGNGVFTFYLNQHNCRFKDGQVTEDIYEFRSEEDAVNVENVMGGDCMRIIGYK